MTHDKFEEELDTIFTETPPGDEFHIQLESLRIRMERKHPALNNLPQSSANVPYNILKAYALAIIAVIYDKNCAESLNGPIKPLDRSEIEKARTVQFAVEKRLNIDPQHLKLHKKLSKSNLHLYGYLLLLITNYDYDHKLKDEYSCIMQAKFIIDLFRQQLPTIDESSQQQVYSHFKDDDSVRLYILSKLSYADMLLNADPALRERLGVMASFDEVHKIYAQHVLERFADSRHLTPQQVIDINLAIDELKSKRELATRPNHHIVERPEDDIYAAQTLISLSTTPTKQEKRSFDQLIEESQDAAANIIDIQSSFNHNRHSFIAKIHLHVTVQAEPKKHMASLSEPQVLDRSF